MGLVRPDSEDYRACDQYCDGRVWYRLLFALARAVRPEQCEDRDFLLYAERSEGWLEGFEPSTLRSTI